ncbi:hypothetical protein GCM10027048_06110 [Hymenobacter coalescens]
MNRHEKNLLLIGTVLIISMAVLRISHHISSSAAQALLVFGGLFAVAAIVRYNRRLKAENHALQARQKPDERPRY